MSLEQLKSKQSDLETQVARLRKQNDLDVEEFAEDSNSDRHVSKSYTSIKTTLDGQNIQDFPHQNHLTLRRKLTGHYGKVYAMHWSGDSERLVSASQDGKLIVWNGITTNKLFAIPLSSPWVMTCAFDQTDPKSRNVACGGLDNLCSIYIWKGNDPDWDGAPSDASVELSGHDGYLSCCRFVDSNRILTSSGDRTCILWNYAGSTHRKLCVFRDHTSDVMCVGMNPRDPNQFVAGDCDATAMVWDIRAPQRATHVFKGHQSDINFVDFLQDGRTFATASDDSTVRLWDTRSLRELRQFKDPSASVGVTSVSASASGRLLFAGYDDYFCRVWDTVGDDGFFTLKGQSQYTHESRVSCVGVAPDGSCLATGGWDTVLKLWS
jgi:guanine nucleotide-binding protein G(I)/G(S)/G(T) subunit beta-1